MHILAAYDGSPYSDYAIEALRRLPHRERVDLSLVTVTVFSSMAAWVATNHAQYGTQLIEPQRAADGRRLEKIADKVRADFRSVRTHLLNGAPGVEIVKFASEHPPDLVICGAIGRSAIARVLLGSVSDYVATSADCSVLVVRPPEDFSSVAASPEAQPPSPMLPQRVLVGIGNAETDGRLTDWIERLRLAPETQVDLVYVMEKRPEYELDLLRSASAYWKEVRSVAAEHIETVTETLTAAGHRVEAELVEAPHIGAALAEHARKQATDLIIVGDQRQSMVQRVLLGSTSRHVLRHGPCSVLIAR
ncbi:universal stress protein [Roseimaritima sediminicola]|uniref:universal stress protein n=1 Tax=Roseimaritima sediminicola TaxID=2662066 RepID=UPI0013866EE2|nr:universal stress protein [Roseimaritima sediminicola]